MTTSAEYIGKYIQLRDKMAEIKKRHTDELAPYKAAMEKLEAMFLDELNKSGADNLSSREFGTVYRNTKKSATVKDPAEFRRFVIGSEAWDLADIRANAPAVEAFMTDNDGEAPPGVSFSTFTTIGVRRS